MGVGMIRVEALAAFAVAIALATHIAVNGPFPESSLSNVFVVTILFAGTWLTTFGVLVSTRVTFRQWWEDE